MKKELRVITAASINIPITAGIHEEGIARTLSGLAARRRGRSEESMKKELRGDDPILEILEYQFESMKKELRGIA